MTRFNAIEYTDGWMRRTASFVTNEKLFQFRIVAPEVWTRVGIVGDAFWVVACPTETWSSGELAAEIVGTTTENAASVTQNVHDAKASWVECTGIFFMAGPRGIALAALLLPNVLAIWSISTKYRWSSRWLHSPEVGIRKSDREEVFIITI
jgi:hypothetical protein